MPYDCSNDRGSARYRVYWLIFCLPYSPSFERFSNAGMIIVKSWTMIEAVIYGATPIATMEKFSNPPPEKIFSKPRSWLLRKSAFKLSTSTPGKGIDAENRNITSIANTNSTRLRRSGSFQICVKNFHIENQLCLCRTLHRTSCFFNFFLCRCRYGAAFNRKRFLQISFAEYFYCNKLASLRRANRAAP